MTLVADIFPKFFTPKSMVTSLPKRSHFRGSVEKQQGKFTQILLKFEGQLLYHIYWSLRRQLPGKKSLLQIWKIWKRFRNTLSADGWYSFLERNNLAQRIQMLFSQKQKTFSPVFSSFVKSSLNLEQYQRKHDTHSWYISEITDSKKHG